MKLLIDGDVIAYVCAYVAKDSLDKYRARRVVRNKLQHICDIWGTYDFEIILTSPNREDNFRHKVATILPYKGNRKSVKPKWLYEIRDYLISVFKAEVVSGIEADDELARRQTDDTMIVTIDKDLFMVPGRVYDTKNDRVYVAYDPGELWLNPKLCGIGFKWFCAQCLLGDRVDNIPGLRGYGDKTVFKVLSNKHTTVDMFYTVIDEYKKNNRFQNLSEVISLLWIRPRDNVYWGMISSLVFEEKIGATKLSLTEATASSEA
jgi:hypothetical protein